MAYRTYLLVAFAVLVAGAFFLVGRLSADSEIRRSDGVLDTRASSVDPCSILTRQQVATAVLDPEFSPSAESTRRAKVCFYTVRGRRQDTKTRVGGDLLVAVDRVEPDDWERYRQYWAGSDGRFTGGLGRVVREGPSGLNVELYADGLVTTLVGRGDTGFIRLLILAKAAAPRIVAAAREP